jgi:unsaturated rhamnogalacturonyl hydrolase
MRQRLVGTVIVGQLVVMGCGSAGEPSDDSPRQAAQATARRVVNAVARYQIATLAEGQYGYGTWNEVAANRAPQGIAWVYPWGVTLYGMLRASEVTGDRTYSTFVIQHNEIVGRYWQYLRAVEATYGPARRAEVDALIRGSSLSRLMALGSLDNTGAMSSQMVEGLLRHGATATAGEQQLLSTVANYIFSVQSRLPDGAFWRPEQNQTLWIDDLYMSCPFLVRWAQHSGDTRYLDDAARQIELFAGRQQDADGLWFHANFIGQGQTSPFKWGRGNGWAMVATVEVLSALPESHAERARLLDILRRHIEGVKAWQASSGRWRQVLNRAELWEETSCTAMFTYAITRAVRRGWIGRENMSVAWKGLEGLAANVTADGQVNETCEGTGIGTTLEFYINRQRPPNDSHGPGPVLLAAAEVLAENGQ